MIMQEASLTPQQIFDIVATHLRKQGRKSMYKNQIDDLSCAYRGQDGAKCAVGCLILDSEYNPRFEGINIRLLLLSPVECGVPQSLVERLMPHYELLRSLQFVHDYNDVPFWEKQLLDVANHFHLNYQSPTAS
jgi:hypothetical protein